MTEDKKMIPLSVIDAKIKEFETAMEGELPYHNLRFEIIMATLKEIKKEAIVPNPSELEQRIKDRIAEMEKQITEASTKTLKELGGKYYLDLQVSIECFKSSRDELRKLLS